MFWARVEVLIPILMLYGEEYFEREYGQVDGTFAHAFERMLSISGAAIDLFVANTDLCTYDKSLPSSNYHFASRG